MRGRHSRRVGYRPMQRVLIVVFDGLQPAQVTPELTPNLSQLAAEGVTFSNNHAAFPTVTRTNVATIVTGHYPGAHGLTANMLVIPEFDPHRAIGAMEPALSQVATKTPVLLRPTLGDILHRHGRGVRRSRHRDIGQRLPAEPQRRDPRRGDRPPRLLSAPPTAPGNHRSIRSLARTDRAQRRQAGPSRGYPHSLRSA